MKKLIFLTLLLNFYTLAFAKAPMASGIKYNIEPLFGFETVFRATPTPHTATHSMYGARLTAGSDIFSGEVEYTKGSDTELFSVAPETIKTDDEKVKLGVRSTYRFNEYLYASGRFGGQAAKSIRAQTSTGVTTTVEDPIKYDPYAGVNIGLKMGPVSVSVGATAIIHDINNNAKNDIQHTISVSMGN